MATPTLDYTAPLSAEQLSLIELTTGNHKTRADGVCIMEAVAWLAGEPHSDAPQCACPTIRRYLIVINDFGPQWLREELQLRLPLIVGSRGSVELQTRRAKIFVAAAIKQAELVLDLFEVQLPNDDRARKAIEAAKSANTADAASAAAYAASAASASAAARAAASAASAADAASAAYAASAAGSDTVTDGQYWRIALEAVDLALMTCVAGAK